MVKLEKWRSRHPPYHVDTKTVVHYLNMAWPEFAVAYDAPGGGVGRYARPAVPLARLTYVRDKVVAGKWDT
eukprot:7017069-Prymnesium_polylepis.1